MHLLEALEKFEVQLQADGRSIHTCRQYARHVRALAAWLEAEGRPTDIAAVDHEDVAAFLNSPAARLRPDGREKKATATNALRSSLRCFFGYVHAAGSAPVNAGRLVRRARCGRPIPRALSDADAERLLATIAATDTPEAKRDHMLFALLLGAGPRIGSALALERDDVDLDEGVLHVRRAKGDQPLRVLLGDGVRAHLRPYLADRQPGPLFAGRSGRPLSARHAQRRLASWCEKAGVRVVHPHALRHGFAMKAYRRCGDIAVVQAALGHRSIASTLVYTRVDDGRLRSVLQ